MSDEQALTKHSSAIAMGDAVVQNGVVVYKNPNVAVVETKTMADVYREHLALQGGPTIAPPDDATPQQRAVYEQADLQRWHELRAARSNSEAPAEYVRRLEAARTPDDVGAAMQWLRTRSAPINAQVAEENQMSDKQRKRALKEFAKHAAERAKRAAELGMKAEESGAVALVDDGGRAYQVSLEKPVTGKDAERLRAQRNVYERRTLHELNEEDNVFRELRSAATAAAMFVKAGNQTPKQYADTSLARYFEGLTPQLAAERVRAFELYQNLRTRPDNQPHRHVQLAPEFFDATCARRAHKDRHRLDRMPFTDPVLVTGEMQRIQQSIGVMLRAAPILDTLFVPSVMYSILTHPQPAPRTVSYSQVFALYFTMARIFANSPDLLPDKQTAKRQQKRERERLRRAGVEPAAVDPRYARANEIVSKATARDYLIGGREACISDFAANLQRLCVRYEKRNKEPLTTADYYRQIFMIVREYMHDVLNAYERAFVLYLDKYIARSDAPSLLTPFHVPSQGIVADEIHTQLLCTNDTLSNCDLRKRAYDAVTVTDDKYAVYEGSSGERSVLPFPDLDEDSKVEQSIYDAHQSLPTFGQVRQLVLFLVHESATGSADIRKQAHGERAQLRAQKQSAPDEKPAPAVAESSDEYRAASQQRLVAQPSADMKPSGVAVERVGGCDNGD